MVFKQMFFFLNCFQNVLMNKPFLEVETDSTIVIIVGHYKNVICTSVPDHHVNPSNSAGGNRNYDQIKSFKMMFGCKVCVKIDLLVQN